MKTELFTDFICIATSGATVDGRNIEKQDLFDIAETYDPSVYTALIWLEHYRFYGNFGRVIEVRAEENNDVVKLFAKIAPNAELLNLNQDKQKIFTSIEITPNFAKTGKAYLTGLAITDSPASTGTTALLFNRIGATDVVVSDHMELDFSNAFNFKEENANLATRFFNWLFSHGDISPTQLNTTANSGNQNTVELENMDKEEFSQQIAAAVASGIATALPEAFAKLNKTEETPPAQEGKSAGEAHFAKTEELNALKQELEELKTHFNQALQGKTPPPSELGNNVANFAIGAESGF